MANQLSISSNFGLLGPIAACDTETALAPLSFHGRKYVRLIQFWGESYSFYFDLKTFNEADWQELKENMEQRDITLIFRTPTSTCGCCRAAASDPASWCMTP